MLMLAAGEEESRTVWRMLCEVIPVYCTIFVPPMTVLQLCLWRTDQKKPRHCRGSISGWSVVFDSLLGVLLAGSSSFNASGWAVLLLISREFGHVRRMRRFGHVRTVSPGRAIVRKRQSGAAFPHQ
jgi:hypothetical protein